MGLNVAEKLIENTPNPDVRIWRAVIALALEDVMITNISYTKEYEKLRRATTKEQRRKHNAVIDKLRKAIFECTD